MTLIRYTRRAGFVLSLVAFAHWFDPERAQWLIDGLWVLAIGLWVAEVQSISANSLLPRRIQSGDVWPIVGLLVVFAAAWLPFCTNWRWAYTGDSGGWFAAAVNAAEDGLAYNLLSVEGGVDGHFTYLHSLASNGLLFVFEPSFLWHRIGKFIVSCLSLVAIYTYFTVAFGRRRAIPIVLCTAVNHVWLWFSYVSYGHIDSYIFYFLTLTLATLIWRQPDHLRLWMLCGLVGGASLFFTQTAWSAVAAVGLVLMPYALVTRRFTAALVYALSFLLLAIPVLLQLPTFLEMQASLSRSVYDWNYLLSIFTAILTLPFVSEYHDVGINGAFLRWPLGYLYVVGMVLAALAVVPAVRRALRLPVTVPVLVALLLWDATLMTLTNHGYEKPSSKRAYSLIPLQIFFALLPFMIAHARSAQLRWRRHAVGALLVATVGIYAAANLRLISSPDPWVYGFNAYDGLIELRQRFPERRVVFFSSREEMPELVLGPRSLWNRAYRLADTGSGGTGYSAEF